MRDRVLEREVDRLEADCQRLTVENLLLKQELETWRQLDRFARLKDFFAPKKGQRYGR